MSERVIIIGAGIVGLCTAYSLVNSGWDVTVIDRGSPLSSRCSNGNAGMIVPSHFVPLAAPGMIAYGMKQLLNPESPFAITPRMDARLLEWGIKFASSCTHQHVNACVELLRDMNLRSRELYIELNEVLGNTFDLTLRGLLMLCKTHAALEHEYAFADRANALGIPADKLTATQVQSLDPSLTVDIAGGVYFPKDAHLSPDRLLVSLEGYLRGRGVKFHWDQTVESVNGQCDVQTHFTTLSADKVVIASGTWSPLLTKDLGVRLPMQGGKGYSFIVDNPVEMPEICSILVESRVAVTPMGGRLRIGGTMEIAGEDLSVNSRRVDGIRKSVAQYFPKFSGHLEHTAPVWSGLRPCSPDGLPYIGAIPSAPNVVVATGHSMMGLSLGPVTGDLVARIVNGQKPEFDTHQLRVNRWG